jgi:hypothetical protein
MRVIGWHDDALAFFDPMRVAIDTDFNFSVEDLNNCIKRSGMFGEALTFVE